MTIMTDEGNDPKTASSVGALYEASGTLLSAVPPPPDGADSFTIDNNQVRIAVLKSGELQLTSLITSDNKAESIKNARVAHASELTKLREALKRTADEKSQAEERYSLAVGGSDDDDTQGKEQGSDSVVTNEASLSLLKLVAQEQSIARKLAKLEHTENLEVAFTTRGGMTATLEPGIVTAVPFATKPMVWCPKSLANQMPLDDRDNVVTVPVTPLRLETPSQILCDELVADLYSMLPSDDVGVLHKLHDQAAGMTATSYDNAVRPHGNILAVIKSSTGHVFGGFYVDPMGSGSGWINGHEDDFIFAMGKKMDQNARMPVKLVKPKGYSAANGIYKGCGLHMHGDLVAFCDAHIAGVPKTYTVPAEGYPNLPQGESISGTPGTFVPTKMEVYQVRTDPLE